MHLREGPTGLPTHKRDTNRAANTQHSAQRIHNGLPNQRRSSSKALGRALLSKCVCVCVCVCVQSLHSL